MQSRIGLKHFITTESGVFVFRGFLNTSIPKILKSKNLCNESLNKLPKNYYFEILVSKYLKIAGTQTPLQSVLKFFRQLK